MSNDFIAPIAALPKSANPGTDLEEKAKRLDRSTANCSLAKILTFHFTNFGR
jgi:hypothetical protein